MICHGMNFLYCPSLGVKALFIARLFLFRCNLAIANKMSMCSCAWNTMLYYVHCNFIQVFNEEIKTSNGSFVFLRCDEGFVRFKGVGNLLVLISYVFGYYIFRYSQREHLSNLTEKVCKI